MKKNRYAPDRGLMVRMGTTIFMLGIVYLGIMFVLFQLGFAWWFILVFEIGLLFAQWYFSDTLALRAMRAVEVTPEEAPQLNGIVDRLCAMSDVPKPRVAIAYTDMPNAFATGRSTRRSVVCVTTGLLERLNKEELEGVLAHELSHVAHRDVTVMMVASSVGLFAGFITDAIIWSSWSDDEDSGFFGGIVAFFVSLLAYTVAWLLTLQLGRYRELSADRGAALLTGKPQALASALTKLSDDTTAIPAKDLRQAQPVNAFFITPAFRGGKGLGSLFDSHPSLEVRLEQLAKISDQLGSATGLLAPGD